jgi:hypothetical protein
MSMAAAQKKDGEVKLRVVLESTDDTPAYYVNYAEVSHSQNEIGISVVRIPTKISQKTLAEAQKTGEIKLEPVLNLIFPPTVIPGLIKALELQKTAYEQAMGKIAGQPDEAAS